MYASPAASFADDGDPPPIATDVQRYLAAPKTCAVHGYWAIHWGSPSLSGSYAYQMEVHQLVYLLPDIAYVRWWLPQFGDGGGSAAQKYDEDTLAKNLGHALLRVSPSTRSNSTGEFQFENVPCGRYFVLYEAWTSLPDEVWDNGDIMKPNRVWNRDLVHTIYESPAIDATEGTNVYVNIERAKSLFWETWRGPESV